MRSAARLSRVHQPDHAAHEGEPRCVERALGTGLQVREVSTDQGLFRVKAVAFEEGSGAFKESGLAPLAARHSPKKTQHGHVAARAQAVVSSSEASA